MKSFSCCSWADVNICAGLLASAEKQIHAEAGDFDFPSNTWSFRQNTFVSGVGELNISVLCIKIFA